MNRLILGLILSLAVNSCFANVTYNKEKLNAMFSSGKLPKVGPMVAKDESVMNFDDCRSNAIGMYTSSAVNFPAKVIADSGVIFIAKIWSSDAELVITCSRSDGKRTITQAVYQ